MTPYPIRTAPAGRAAFDPDAPGQADNGIYAGTPLPELLRRFGAEMAGTAAGDDPLRAIHDRLGETDEADLCPEADGVRYLPVRKGVGIRDTELSGRTERKVGGGSLHLLVFLRGDATVGCRGSAGSPCGSALRAHCGETVLIPAGAEAFSVAGDCRFLDLFLPDFDRDYLEPLAAAGVPLAKIRGLCRS